MKKKILTIAATLAMTVMMSVSTFAASFNLTASDSYKYANPLKGKNPTEVTIEYKVLAGDGAMANGWDGLMSFYNSSTLGRVSIQSHPYVCWNSANASAGWIDHKANVLSIKKNEEQSYKIVIKADGIQMYLNDTLLESANTGTSASDATPIEVTFQNILDEINGCDYFFVGVGQATYAYWSTEVCTLSDVKINGEEFKPDNILQEETTTLGKPEKNTMNYGAEEEVEEDSSFSIAGISIAGIIGIAAVAVVAIIAVIVVVIVLSKKKKNVE